MYEDFFSVLLTYSKGFIGKMIGRRMASEMKNKACVTIITATYNLIKNKRVKCIRKCIESVHNQTYPHIEHIIIDGASNDGSLKLLQEYVDLGWVTLYSESDTGIYDAMNKGISKANGKYINMLNSDDFFHDNRCVEVNVDYLERNDADYSYGDALVLKTLGRKTLWKGDLTKLLIGTHYCHQTMFVKTDILRHLGGFNLSYRVSADSDLMIRLYAQEYKPIYVPFSFLSFKKGGFSSQHEKQMRVDHSTSFFKHIGCKIGLSEKDCFQLWHMQLFVEESIEKQLELLCKVPVEFGMEMLFREFVVRSPSKEELYGKRRFYLFGFIPFWEQQICKNVHLYFLFNIFNIMKIVDFNGKRKYYLFGFLPILKIQRYR